MVCGVDLCGVDVCFAVGSSLSLSLFHASVVYISIFARTFQRTALRRSLTRIREQD